MALILCIETATSLCSVALSKDGSAISFHETLEEKSHASSLTVFIKEILRRQNIAFSDLDAVAVGKGPGSYTGLRIGVSTAKGLCYGAGIPIISQSTLKIMFRQVIETATQNIADLSVHDLLFCPMIDARRMEIYTCLYDFEGNEVESVSAKIVDSTTFIERLEQQHIVFFGSGMEKCREVIHHQSAHFIQSIYPHASALAGLAEIAYRQKEFEDIAYFEPFYLKDFIATKSKKGIMI